MRLRLPSFFCRFPGFIFSILSSFFFIFTVVLELEGALRSSFGKTVEHVVGSGPVPKVLRIYADRIIAPVTDFSSGRYFSFEFPEHDPVRQIVFYDAVLSPCHCNVPGAGWLALMIPAAGDVVDFHFHYDPHPRSQGLNNFRSHYV
jgi:hypothetical protein